jgi:polysaccharide deacetylase 2 family uncharacterized protein YibQ
MTMPSFGDDLDKPLGADIDISGSRARDVPYVGLAVAGFAALAASLAAFAYATSDGTGGEPIAVVRIETAVAKKPLEPAPAAAIAPSESPAGADQTGSIPAAKQVASADDIESRSGVRVMRPRGMTAPGALIIEVPQPGDMHLTPAPDKRLVERVDGRVLPRIGPDGSRPSDVYARPLVVPSSLKPWAPRIAIMVGGMGLNRVTTAQAIADLPGAVTLGFAPYGGDLAADAARARDGGHEIVLQVPMEPFDYPSNDPGPQTLTSAADAAQNIERLHWLMSRFPGYVGIVNFLGGKFTQDAAALTPILREAADRGLIYADDGTSTRSLAGDLAAGLPLPIARADVAIDAAPTPEAIDAALARLEKLALRNGLAVGSANGLPVSLDRIARWARGLEGRGILLVPLSAAATRQPNAGAGARNGG